MPGKVKWFDKKKGFGFITDDSITDDVFVHYSDLEGTGFRYLSENDEVEYDLIQGPKGFQAKRVSVVKSAQGASGSESGRWSG